MISADWYKTVLSDLNRAYNGRRHRVLKGRSPGMVSRERLTAKPELANPVTKPPDPDALPKSLKIVVVDKKYLTTRNNAHDLLKLARAER